MAGGRPSWDESSSEDDDYDDEESTTISGDGVHCLDTNDDEQE